MVKNFEAQIFGYLKTSERSLETFDLQAQAILESMEVGEKDHEKREQEEKERSGKIVEASYEISKELEQIEREFNS